jgi:nucleotide-binding universal stress UspA family protein
MFQQILLPLDLTDRHQRALDIAAELAARAKAAVTLLHVIETLAGLSVEEEKGFYQRLDHASRGHLDRWGKQLGDRHVAWRAEVRYGHRAAECVRYVREVAADLIVLTAPPIDPDNPAIGLGSMSYKVGVLSPCPVLLVK